MEERKTEIAYISGPITGYTNLNRDAFEKADADLQKQGYITVNPHGINKELDNKWNKKLDELGVSWDSMPETIRRQIWEDYMKNDIKHLMTCTVLFALEGWETSKGARVEIYLAKTLGLKVYLYKTMLELYVDLNLVKGNPAIV